MTHSAEHVFNTCKLHQTRNRETADAWQSFAGHRERITQLLLELAQGDSGALNVLGAGNTNDVDLVQLLKSFSRIDLFDIDSAAMHQGAQRQLTDSVEDQVGFHETDLSGIADILNANPPAPEVYSQLEHSLLAEIPETREPASITASLCVFSQIVDTVGRWCGGLNKEMVQVLAALREQHVRQLLAHTRPGGKCLFVTDMVSSLTWPDVADVPPEQLAAACGQQIQRRNFFAGTNPAMWHDLLATKFSENVNSLRILDPWLWNPGPRTYVVYGIVFSKSG